MTTKVTDLTGTKHLARPVNKAIDKSLKAAEVLLATVCKPALQELGLMLRDRVQEWRINNILRVLDKAKGKIQFKEDKLRLSAHPRVALSIIENASMIDDDAIQDLWAGLFASSCIEESTNSDENLVFVNLLKQISSPQARILEHACKNAKINEFENGLIFGEEYRIPGTELVELTGINDIQRLDRELDYLRAIYLLRDEAGFRGSKAELVADITPTTLCLHLYARCRGHNGSPLDFYKKQIIRTNKRKQKANQDKEKIDLRNK